MITTTRIEQSSLNQLRELAKAHRRSMTQELAVIIETTNIEANAAYEVKAQQEAKATKTVKYYGALQKPGKGKAK